MNAFTRSLLLVVTMLGLVRSTAIAQTSSGTAPESFTAAMQRSDQAAIAGALLIRIERFTSIDNRQKMTDALEYGGYPAFLAALRKASDVGYIAIGDHKVILRWARQEQTGSGRRIILITESPVAVVSGTPAAIAPQGDEVTVLELEVDTTGRGSGTMVVAAHVKANPIVGAGVEDPKAERIRLTGVTRTAP